MFWIILGIFFAFAVGCFLVFNYFKEWDNYKTFNSNAVVWHDKSVELTFDEVMKYSAIKPDKWTITKDSISYKITKKNIIGENKFFVRFKTYKDYVNFIQQWEDKKDRQKREEELRIGLEFCDLMKEDCRALKEESQKAIHKATVESVRLIKKTIEEDADLNNIYMCKVNEDGTVEIIKKPTKTVVLSDKPFGSITCK